MSSNDTPNPERKATNRALRYTLLVAVPLVALVAIGFVYLHGGRYIGTDNAYVKSDKVPVSADVSGPAIQIAVEENQFVAEGALLFSIDPAPYKIAVAKAQASLEQVRTDLTSQKAAYHSQQAALALAKTKYNYARKKQKREANLVEQKLISDADFDDATMLARIAKLEITASEHELERIADSLGGAVDEPVESHPRYQQAMAELENAKLDFARTQIKAPFAGIVSQLPKPGQYIHAGGAALSLVAAERFWVEANLTEKELTHVQQSQPVNITIDMYPGKVWHGVVDTLSPATGAEFAIIPAQNATGNWVKIAQRVPVRIALTDQDDLPRLRSGLSAEIKIDTGFRRQILGQAL